jgi:hypothetical protein
MNGLDEDVDGHNAKYVVGLCRAGRLYSEPGLLLGTSSFTASGWQVSLRSMRRGRRTASRPYFQHDIRPA